MCSYKNKFNDRNDTFSVISIFVYAIVLIDCY